MKNKILIGIVIFIALAVAVGLVVLSLRGFKNDEKVANYNGVETNYNTVKNNEVGNNVTENQIDTKNASLEELPQSYTIEQAIKDGSFTIMPHAVYNKEYLDDFIEKTKYDAKNRVASSIRIATTTIEGQLILYDLSFDGENYILKRDLTRDEYSANEDRIIETNSDIPENIYTINLKQSENSVNLELDLVAEINQNDNGKNYEDIFIVSYPSNATIYPVAPEFRAEVLEVLDNVMWIKPIENGEGLGDKLLINTQGKDFEVGDNVRVIYTGLIRDTYPAQIDVISVEKFEIYN